MLSDSQPKRISRVIQTLGVLVLCLLMIPALDATALQASPDPRPDILPHFYDPAGVFDEGQRSTLERDAKLLQSSSIPTVIYVRSSTEAEAQPEAARTMAETIRREWAVETAPGADDGLVLLYSHVPDHPQASTIVASWGPTALEGNGLTPDYIASVLNGDARTLLNQEHPFEAVVYAIRELRYAGIYYPPIPAPLAGATQALHTTLGWVAPLVLMSVIATHTTISIRLTHSRAMSQQLVWKITGATGLIVALLGTGSVIGRSRIGMASTLLILIALAVQVWLWTHPARRPIRGMRQRSVSPTSRRMRRASQARRMHALAEGRK